MFFLAEEIVGSNETIKKGIYNGKEAEGRGSMFIKTIRINKKLCAVLAICCIVICGIFITGSIREQEVFSARGGMDYNHAGSAQERLALTKQMGWEVTEEPVRIQEVIIPEEFDAVYMEYNELQKIAGFDLEPYQGKLLKLYSYEILNGQNKPDDPVNLTLLVHKGKVVGGDISSVKIDGFMRELYQKQ